MKLTIPLVVFAMFQLKFAIITPALFTGSRSQSGSGSPAYLLFMILFSLLIYCPLAHMPRGHPDGHLLQMGREGLRRRHGGPHVGRLGGPGRGDVSWDGARPTSVKIAHTSRPTSPTSCSGTGLLWFGWFGFNAGSALKANGDAALAFATTNTASAAAMLGWIFFDWFRGKKPSALGACIGAVVGLVAITPAAGFVTVAQSITIGLTASVISNLAVHLRTKSTLDDTLDVFPCHGVGGMVGMIYTGVFAALPADGSVTRTSLLIAHGKALVLVSVFAFVGSLILYKVTDLVIPLRVTSEQEEEGLDLSQHGETALGADVFAGAAT